MPAKSQVAIRAMIANGVPEIDLTADDNSVIGHESYAAKQKRTNTTPLTEAQLVKLSKEERATLDARPLTFIPPHPAVVAAAEHLGDGRAGWLKYVEDFRKQLNKRGIDAWQGSSWRNWSRAELLDEALTNYALHPKDICAAGLVAWYGGEPLAAATERAA